MTCLRPGCSAGPPSWKSWDGSSDACAKAGAPSWSCRGEPGIGKTELLRHLIAEVPGFGVARVAGVESEMELPFAGLHQLCAAMLGRARVAGSRGGGLFNFGTATVSAAAPSPATPPSRAAASSTSGRRR